MSKAEGPKYAVFAGDIFYAHGGWSDFIGVFSSLTEASEVGKKFGGTKKKWFHIVDLSTLRVVDGTKMQAYSADDLAL